MWPTHKVLLIGLVAFCIAACGERPSEKPAEKPRPQQAGQPVNSYATAGHILGARAAVVAGNTRAAEQHINAMANDLARSARVRDVRRPSITKPRAVRYVRYPECVRRSGSMPTICS